MYPLFLVYRELDLTGKFSRMDKETDEAEHSIEMHLPYIAKIMDRYQELVPYILNIYFNNVSSLDDEGPILLYLY